MPTQPRVLSASSVPGDQGQDGFLKGFIAFGGGINPLAVDFLVIVVISDQFHFCAAYIQPVKHIPLRYRHS